MIRSLILMPAHLWSAALLASYEAYYAWKAATQTALPFLGNTRQASDTVIFSLYFACFLLVGVYAHVGASSERNGLRQLEAWTPRSPFLVTAARLGPGIALLVLTHSIIYTAAYVLARSGSGTGRFDWPMLVISCSAIATSVSFGYVIGRTFPSRFVPLFASAGSAIAGAVTFGAIALYNFRWPPVGFDWEVWQQPHPTVLTCQVATQIAWCVFFASLSKQNLANPRLSFHAIRPTPGMAFLAAAACSAILLVLPTGWVARSAPDPVCHQESAVTLCAWPESSQRMRELAPAFNQLAIAFAGTPGEFHSIGQPGLTGTYDALVDGRLERGNTTFRALMASLKTPGERCEEEPTWDAYEWDATLQKMKYSVFPEDMFSGLSTYPGRSDDSSWIKAALESAYQCQTAKPS